MSTRCSTPSLKLGLEQRGAVAREAVVKGCPAAMHALGLLMYSGYGGEPQSDGQSAMWHALAAVDDSYDAMVVVWGCLRKGSALGQDMVGGVALIDMAAAVGSAVWLVKQAGLLEDAGDDASALKLYKRAVEAGDEGSALTLFNLGWVLLHRDLSSPESARGENCWRRAVQLAPRDGSEEAAYHLSLRLVSGGSATAVQARALLELSAALGLSEARADL